MDDTIECKKPFLDTSKLKEFEEKINSTNIFYESEKHKPRWNLICVFMDRLESAVDYLNKHSLQPKSEEDLIFFMVFASILKDGIYAIYKNMFGKEPCTTENKKWFIEAMNCFKKWSSQDGEPTDDAFFEYLRAVSFAHPFNTSRNRCSSSRPFMAKNEIHLSLWVINKGLLFGKLSVGVRIYSNQTDDIQDIYVKFENLKSYVKERYDLIESASQWVEDEIKNQNDEWKQKNIVPSQDAVDTLKNIISILDERFVDTYTIESAQELISFEFNEVNKEKANHVKSKISNILPLVCDSINELDYEKMEELLSFLSDRPEKLHKGAHYQLEKIFTYLPQGSGPFMFGSNEQWAYEQAKHFYNEYAHRYVLIDFAKMNCLEIKLLIQIACILGCETESKE